MSRIIPKEQLAGYQRWQIGSFDKPATPSAAPTEKAQASPAPEGLLDSSMSESGTVVEIPFPTADDLARINDAARTEGYQAGYEEGLAVGKAEFDARTADQTAQFSTIIGNLQVSLAHLDQNISDQLLDLSIEIAAQVLRSALTVHRELLLPTIREALAELPLHHGTISLHLSPADAEALSALLKDQLAHTGAHIVPDVSIAEGGCQIKAGSSEIDASIETRWRRVIEAIGIEATQWLPKT
jgi:flagellar assembly protein FliH